MSSAHDIIRPGDTQREGRLAPINPFIGVPIPSSETPYLERVLKWYLKLGIIEEKWIPQIREQVAETGMALIPAREGVVRLRDPVQFSFEHTTAEGKTFKVYPVSVKPWATFLRWGASTDGPLRGKCIWMDDDSFFLTHGADGLPLDI